MLGRWLCGLKLHSYSRWEQSMGTAWNGNKPMDVMVQQRECIRRQCGYTQMEMIKAKVMKL